MTLVATSLSGGLAAFEAVSGKPAGPRLNPKTADRAFFTALLDAHGTLLGPLSAPLHLSWPNNGADPPKALSGKPFLFQAAMHEHFYVNQCASTIIACSSDVP